MWETLPLCVHNLLEGMIIQNLHLDMPQTMASVPKGGSILTSAPQRQACQLDFLLDLMADAHMGSAMRFTRITLKSALHVPIQIFEDDPWHLPQPPKHCCWDILVTDVTVIIGSSQAIEYQQASLKLCCS